MTTCPSCTIDLDQDATYCGLCGRRVRARRGTLVGTRLNDRYRIDAKIAEGGFGAIYRATHVDGHEVALKVLHADLASDPSLAARFRREGATLASLRDPHTVATYELGEAPDGTLYIAMELLHGESLLDRFQTRGPLPWRRVLEIVRAVCSSLAEAHGLGIVHRDLKPANIHLADNDFVKLLDFGIAKVQRPSDIRLSDSLSGAELTRAGQAIGTLAALRH
jgi:eukaryotic-like serine/threonine-protein kinase